MKKRTLLTVSAILLLTAGTLHAIEEPAKNDMDLTRIFPLDYCSAGELAEILGTTLRKHDISIATSEQNNLLVVTAPPDVMELIRDVVSVIDDPSKKAKTPQMLYRVYMLEPPIDQDTKGFSLTVAGSERISATDSRLMAKKCGLQIDSITQHGPANDMWEDHIQGRAPAREAVWDYVDYYPDAQILELVWEDEAFMTVIPAAQFTALSAPLQAHLRSLLGEKIETVGYWFGSLSLPGEFNAPIGPLWNFELDIEATRTDELECEIQVHQELSDGEFMTVIGNRIRARIGKPIIIGYNRDRCGTRTMGALVIVAEEDKTPASPINVNTEAR